MNWLKGINLTISLTILALHSAHSAECFVEETGGSNVVAVDLQPDKLSSAEEWKDNTVFHPPYCFENGRSTDLSNTLHQMWVHGQRKMALIIWHAHLDADVHCAGFLLNSNNSDAVRSAIDNIRYVISQAKSIGFNEIQVRFAPQWINDPFSWTEWNAELFDENRRLINQVSDNLPYQGIKILYDLGVEYGGLADNVIGKNYVTRIWNEYSTRSSSFSDYGFSIALSKGRVSRYFQWLSESSLRPREIAVDVYSNSAELLHNASDEAAQHGSMQPTFVVQETFFNNETLIDELKSLLKDGIFKIRTIMQWPLTPGSKASINLSSTYQFAYKRDEACQKIR